MDTSMVAQPKQQQPLYEVEIIRHPHPYPFVNSFGAAPLTIVANKELGGQDGARSVRHIQIALPASMPYRTGDHLGIVASNGAALVKRVADHFQFDEQTIIRLHKTNGRKHATPLNEPISVYAGDGNYIELHDLATRADSRRMAEYIDHATARQRL